MSRFSRNFMRKSSAVDTHSADNVKWLTSIVFSSSLPSSVRELWSSSQVPFWNSLHNHRLLSCIPEPKPFSKISKIFRVLSRSLALFVKTQFRAVPSRLLVSAMHACSNEKVSSSKWSFITSILGSMQLSYSSLNDFGFLSDRSPLSVCFECFVMNVSWDLLSGPNMDAYIVVSCETIVRPGTQANRSQRRLPPLARLESSNVTLVALLWAFPFPCTRRLLSLPGILCVSGTSEAIGRLMCNVWAILSVIAGQ